jgi:hypothetical protein
MTNAIVRMRASNSFEELASINWLLNCFWKGARDCEYLF